MESTSRAIKTARIAWISLIVLGLLTPSIVFAQTNNTTNETNVTVSNDYEPVAKAKSTWSKVKNWPVINMIVGLFDKSVKTNLGENGWLLLIALVAVLLLIKYGGWLGMIIAGLIVLYALNTL